MIAQTKIPRVLITGTNSGLGASLNLAFQGDCFDRTQEIQAYQSVEYDLIIHCAVDVSKDVPHASIDKYFQTNVELTRDLLSIPHKRFIFISSVDVYPKNQTMSREEASINAHDILGVYGLTKYYSEALVKEHGNSSLILRPTALLGPTMRTNTLIRILTNQSEQIKLSGHSKFNFVLHKDIANIINSSLMNNIQGILNVCSNSNVALNDIASCYDKTINFGDYEYTIPNLDNSRLLSLFPSMNRSSLETIDLFWTSSRKHFS